MSAPKGHSFLRILYWKGLDFVRITPGRPRTARHISPEALIPPTIAHLELARGGQPPCGSDHLASFLEYSPIRIIPGQRSNSVSRCWNRRRAGDPVRDRFHRARTVHRYRARVPGALWRPRSSCPSFAGAMPPSGFCTGTMGGRASWRRCSASLNLLVAPRGGHFSPPAEYRHRIHALPVQSGHEEVSSTEVRERIARGEPWEHLVPEKIRERVREIYS